MMLQFPRPVALVPVHDVVVSGSVQAAPAFEQMDYAPDVLLPFPALDVRLLNDAEFMTGCEVGYEDYFELMYEEVPDCPDEVVFVHHAYTVAEVAQYLQENLRSDSAAFLRFFHVPATTLAYRAGFVFGWLSALALYDASLVALSLPFFVACVQLLLQREEAQSC